MALSVLDAAIWDALAVAAGLPLATLLGARPRPIPAYNSSGLGLMSPEAAADEAEKLLAGGFRSVKLRLGHTTLEEDLAVTRAVRKRLPDAIELPVDYNQALSITEAIRRGRALESEGIAWFEEPIRHDDYVGSAAVARALAVPVQIGENFNGPGSMVEALGAGACDYVMPDAARIGWVTGWIQAAGIAAAHRIGMSSHLLPEISAHLLAATPTCHYLEYVDWADAILEEQKASALIYGIFLARQKAVAERATDLVGTWVLVSSTLERGGMKTDYFGPNPQGQLMFGPDGHFSAIFTRSDLPKFDSNNRQAGTPEENKAVVQGSIAVFGMYSVNGTDDIITFHIEGSTFPNWNGTAQNELSKFPGTN
jgi:hypothetical protein